MTHVGEGTAHNRVLVLYSAVTGPAMALGPLVG